MPLVIVGADADNRAVSPLTQRLRQKGYMAHSFIDLPPTQVVSLIQNASYFICYQSGLGVPADNLGVPQMMLYFKELEKLKYAWCRHEHVGTVFQAASFNENPGDVAKRIVAALPISLGKRRVQDEFPHPALG